MINAKHVAFVHQIAEEPVQRPRTVQVFAERFLENHLAVSRKARAAERQDRGGEDSRGQSEVDRDGALTG